VLERKQEVILEMPLEFRVARSSDTDSAFEEFYLRVQTELDRINREDIVIGANIPDRSIMFTMYDVDPNHPSLDDFLVSVRSALHAAGCWTPGWDRVQADWESSPLRLELQPA